MKLNIDTKIDPLDYKFAPVDPDPDFDPKRNQEVIDFTIKRSEELWREKQRKFNEGIKERSEAISTYAEAVKMGRTNSNYKNFFGKEYLYHLKGQKLVDELKKKYLLGEKLTKKVEKFYAKTKQQRPA